jgi:hypothetical protein
MLCLGLGCGPMLQEQEEDETSGGVRFTTLVQDEDAEPPPEPTTGATEPETSAFIVMPDVTATDIACNVWTGEPCGPGEKCMPWDSTGAGGWNASRCTPIAPDPAGPGEPCTVEGLVSSGIDDCEARSMCWGVDPETSKGVCTPFCMGTESAPTCTDPCHKCSLTASGVLILCLPRCDPLAQDCRQGLGCYPHGIEFGCFPYAGGDDAGQPGDPCMHLNVCEPGSFCASASAVPGCTGSRGCCAPICDLEDVIPCPSSPGTVCVPWFDEGQASPVCGPHDRVGLCLLPE